MRPEMTTVAEPVATAADLVPGTRYRVRGEDCCLEVEFDAELVHAAAQGEVDAWAPAEVDRDEVVWPAPVTYWSNGVRLLGHQTWEEVVEP